MVATTVTPLVIGWSGEEAGAGVGRRARPQHWRGRTAGRHYAEEIAALMPTPLSSRRVVPYSQGRSVDERDGVRAGTGFACVHASRIP